MNIKNDYQKRIGQITSFPTGEIIEPNRKYLESNLFYPLSNFHRVSLERYRKVNRSKEFAKLTGERYKVSTILITNSFPEIDKDLKTDF